MLQHWVGQKHGASVKLLPEIPLVDHTVIFSKSFPKSALPEIPLVDHTVIFSKSFPKSAQIHLPSKNCVKDSVDSTGQAQTGWNLLIGV